MDTLKKTNLNYSGALSILLRFLLLELSMLLDNTVNATVRIAARIHLFQSIVQRSLTLQTVSLFDFLLAIPNLRNLILHSLSLPVGLIEVMLKCVQFRKLFFKFPEQSENGRALPISWKLKIAARDYRNAAFKVKIDGKDSFCKNIERVKALLRKKLPFFVE